MVADPGAIWVRDGIRPGWLYDLVYVGRDPRHGGLGPRRHPRLHVVLPLRRRRSPGKRQPLTGCVDRACLFGISQSGRAVPTSSSPGSIPISAAPGLRRGPGPRRGQRAAVYATFRRVNGLLGPSRKSAGADRAVSFHHRARDRPAHRASWRPAGPRRPRMPKIFLTQTSTEYWTRAASLTHTDVDGRQDVALDPDVRLYCIAGAQHLGGGPADRGICQNPRNTLDDRGPVLRALLVALDRWASTGRQPPESRYPRLAGGTLVDLPAFGKLFPPIPGVNLPGDFYRPFRLDFGPRWESEGIADCVPPRAGPVYRTLVPAVDADGNEVAGIRLPDVAVPLGTYTGWNLRGAACGAEGNARALSRFLPAFRRHARRAASHG